MNEWLRGLLRSPGTTAGISALVVIPGFVISLDAANIATAFKRFYAGQWSGGPYFPAVLSAGLFFAWVIGLYLSTREDRRRRDEEMERQGKTFERALFRTPNLDVLTRYPKLLREISLELRDRAVEMDRETVSAITSGDLELTRTKHAAHVNALRNVLLGVAQMAKTFGRRPEDAVYGCNLMLLQTPSSLPDHAIFPCLHNRNLIFVDRSPGDYGGLRAVLYTSNLLTVDTTEGDGLAYDRTEIALPVPERDDRYEPLLLPGAPLVFVEGRPRVYEDTRNLIDHCKDFAKPVRDWIHAYFSAGDLRRDVKPGAGAKILSFASYRIGTDDIPIGVLNVDCSDTHLLGDEEGYYPTFTALLTPVLDLLMQPIAAFSWLEGVLAKADTKNSLQAATLVENETVSSSTNGEVVASGRVEDILLRQENGNGETDPHGSDSEQDQPADKG